MTRRAITIRVDPATVDALDAYAAEHGLPGRGRALDAIIADHDAATQQWLDGMAGVSAVPLEYLTAEDRQHLPTWVARGWVQTEPDGRLVRRTTGGRQRRCVVPTDAAPT